MSQAIVVPCYNEEMRLPAQEVRQLIEGTTDLKILFVNDGSTDGTLPMLNRLASDFPRISVLNLEQNQGKAEAVRQGLLQLATTDHKWIGYCDGDFATPASEILRLLAVAEERGKDVVMASRVRLLGTEIDRKLFRHYLGRVFATIASMALNLPVYDTQCGAKLFRPSVALRESLKEPFTSRWAFDVELLGRLRSELGGKAQDHFLEVPLNIWRDVKGSKLRLKDMVKAGVDLLKIAYRMRLKTSAVQRIESKRL